MDLKVWGKKGVKPLRSYSEPINSKLYIFLGDITELQVDSIVNAANNTLLGGGGVDGAIHAAAGPALRTECSKLGGCSTGDAKITGGHNLPSKHIIHTVGPRGRKPDVLRSSYSRCFELMREHNLKSIAFPCISTGVYGYPNKAAAEVAVETARDFLEKNLEQVDAVIFCLFTNKDIETYHEILPAYFPLGSEDGTKHESKSESDEAEECGNVVLNEGVNIPAATADGSGTSTESENGAKCQGDSEKMSQEQSEPMSQEQSEPMNQEQLAAAHQKQEEEEPMSLQQEGGEEETENTTETAGGESS